METIGTARKTKQPTYKDCLKLDNTICEVVNGKFFLPPSPDLLHQDVLRDLQYELWHHVRRRGLGKVYGAPTEVRFNDRNIVLPDLTFVAADNLDILKPKAIEGTPDLLIEITSATTLYRDNHLKKGLYEKMGVKEYWIVDPAHHALQIFTLGKDGGYELHCFVAEEGLAASRLLDGFGVDLEALICPK